jgi:spoIIIJ-associated protein
MSPNNWIEATAPTVEAAISQALEQLGVSEDKAIIEVLSTPRSGLLGIGARPAKVRVQRRQPEGAPSEARPQRQIASGGGEARPADEASARRESEEGAPERQSITVEEQGREAVAMLNQILGLMGETADVVVAASDDEGIELELKGDGSGILIGRRGQTLDALEYLVNRIVARRFKDPVPILVDTESYRTRRRQQLERMALSMGEQAKRENKPVTLEPMPPRDRRIIHLALKDDPLVTTRSEGTGYLRSVEIVPAEGRRERGPRERSREREPLGQQGGFKHGQKKIV